LYFGDIIVFRNRIEMATIIEVNTIVTQGYPTTQSNEELEERQREREEEYAKYNSDEVQIGMVHEGNRIDYIAYRLYGDKLIWQHSVEHFYHIPTRVLTSPDGANVVNVRPRIPTKKELAAARDPKNPHYQTAIRRFEKRPITSQIPMPVAETVEKPNPHMKISDYLGYQLSIRNVKNWAIEIPRIAAAYARLGFKVLKEIQETAVGSQQATPAEN
jgi:hypothetical protein